MGLPDLAQHLETLLAQRLIEAVPTATAVAPRAAPRLPVPATAATPAPVAATQPTLPSVTAAPTVGEDPRLQQLQRQAFLLLRQHFGPDTPTVAQAVFAARTLDDFRQGLNGIEAKLAIYLGRRQAARELDGLRGAAR